VLPRDVYTAQYRHHQNAKLPNAISLTSSQAPELNTHTHPQLPSPRLCLCSLLQPLHVHKRTAVPEHPDAPNKHISITTAHATFRPYQSLGREKGHLDQMCMPEKNDPKLIFFSEFLKN
jgi:hypothetical protein